jgi:hypothetical protein
MQGILFTLQASVTELAEVQDGRVWPKTKPEANCTNKLIFVKP